jgi:tetratricopeptide (TPR) repeat protein
MRTSTCLVVSSLLLSLPVFAQDAGAPAAAPAATTDAATFVSQLDELWKTRDAAESAKAIDEAIKNALAAFPNDYELLWRAARYRWWVADGLTEEKAKRMKAKAGWDYAERAIKVKPTGAEAKYFLAINIGAYSQAVGILTALGEGLEGKFVENLDYAIKNNESFDRYGARTAKGRYYWELPWPKRDLKKSKEELQKSIDKHPEHLRNYLFLADTLLKDGDAKGAKVAIDKALNGDAAYDPPEARRIKAWAKTTADQIAKELK